ncbi:hypothetical protein D1007_14135 [Hordeum vulgare]|nr:hypothetical protein D1007_14135 [Hordeum vulgare]
MQHPNTRQKDTAGRKVADLDTQSKSQAEIDLETVDTSSSPVKQSGVRMEVDKDPRKRLNMDVADAVHSSLPNQPNVLLAITDGSGVDETKTNVQVIRETITSPSQEEDFISWFPDKFGQFSVKSTYYLALQQHVQTHDNGACSTRPERGRPCWNLIWQAKVPNKMHSFAWRVDVDALPTNECKARHHIPVHAACRVCGVMEDSSFHALVICPKSLELWDLMRQDWPLPAKEKRVDTGKEWLFGILANHNEEVHAMTIILLWRILESSQWYAS